MLTKLIIKNFKRFDDVKIELANPVVFVGPNNSGKTSALQAIALWNIGAKRWIEKRKSIIKECISQIVPPIALNDKNDTWWIKTKMSDDFLDRVFELYFKKLNLPNTFRKTNYHQLVELMKKEDVNSEVKEKLDAIVEIAKMLNEELELAIFK